MQSTDANSENTSEATPWYRDGLAFTCTQCGQCCSGDPGYVFVEPEEIEAMAGQMELTVDEFEYQFVRRAGRDKSLKEYPDGDCILLDPETRRCLVYRSRPIQCRTWPFWDSNLESRATWKATCESCPGAGVGEVYSFEQIEKQRTEKIV